jgi:hypothetical protein
MIAVWSCDVYAKWNGTELGLLRLQAKARTFEKVSLLGVLLIDKLRPWHHSRVCCAMHPVHLL